MTDRDLFEADRARGCILSRSSFEAGIASVAAPGFAPEGARGGAVHNSPPESHGPARGPRTPTHAPEVPPARTSDRWTRMLLITACVLAGITLAAFGGYEIHLGSGVSQVQRAGMTAQ